MEEQKVVWLELFYDLVFVITIAQVADYFHDHFTAAGLIQTSFIFVAIWYAWLSSIFYYDRFGCDNSWHRFMSAMQMLLIAGVAVTIGDVFTAAFQMFIYSYATFRFSVVFMYLIAAYRIPESRSVAMPLAIAYSLVIALWLISICLPAEYRYYCWGAALAVDITTPLILRKYLANAKISLSQCHLPERMGLFTMIVLGEAVAGIVHGMLHTGITTQALWLSLCGLLIIFTIWWLYYDNADEEVMSRPFATILGWEYLHLPLLLSIMLLSVIIQYMITQEANVMLLERYALVSSLAVIFASLSAFNQICYKHETVKSRACWQLIQARRLGALVCIGLLAVASLIPLNALVSIVTVIALLQVGHNMRLCD